MTRIAERVRSVEGREWGRHMRTRYYLECKAGDKGIVIVIIIDHRHIDHDINHRHSSRH